MIGVGSREGVGVAPGPCEDDQTQPDDDHDDHRGRKPERPALTGAPIAAGTCRAATFLAEDALPMGAKD